MIRLLCFCVQLVVVANVLSAEHRYLIGEPVHSQDYHLNGRSFRVELKVGQGEGAEALIPKQLAIDHQIYDLKDAEAVGMDELFHVFAIDLNQDGYTDLGYLIRSGVSNRYFVYFLYDADQQGFLPLGEFPELYVEEAGLVSYEKDGPAVHFTRYHFEKRQIVVD